MTHSSVGYCVKVRTRSKSGLMNSTFGRLQSGGTLANQMQEITLGSHWIRCTNLKFQKFKSVNKLFLFA